MKKEQFSCLSYLIRPHKSTTFWNRFQTLFSDLRESASLPDIPPPPFIKYLHPAVHGRRPCTAGSPVVPLRIFYVYPECYLGRPPENHSGDAGAVVKALLPLLRPARYAARLSVCLPLLPLLPCRHLAPRTAPPYFFIIFSLSREFSLDKPRTRCYNSKAQTGRGCPGSFLGVAQLVARYLGVERIIKASPSRAGFFCVCRSEDLRERAAYFQFPGGVVGGVYVHCRFYVSVP